MGCNLREEIVLMTGERPTNPDLCLLREILSTLSHKDFLWKIYLE